MITVLNKAVFESVFEDAGTGALGDWFYRNFQK